MHALLRVLLFAVLLVPTSAIHAQIPLGGQQINILISPEYPRPYDSVVAKLESSYYNLAGASVKFYVNGSLIDTQDGKQVQFTVGGAGTRTTLVAEVAVEGSVQNVEVKILPAEVSLIQEPLSTGFPLYKGGSLLGPEGTVRLVAIPNLRRLGGELIPQDELVYEWRLGSKILSDYSGIGRSTLTATAPVQYRNADIVLTVRDPLLSVAAQTRLPITSTQPFIQVYKKDPLMGLMTNRAISDNYTLTETEETFTAVPFFFNNRPTISWNVAGNPTAGENVTVRREGTDAGRASIAITATDSTALQSAGRTFIILFERLTSNLFTL